MACGQFFSTWFIVNPAHTMVQSNDYLSQKFYETLRTLGAKLALPVAERPSFTAVLGANANCLPSHEDSGMVRCAPLVTGCSD
jgi:hypothetical protein